MRLQTRRPLAWVLRGVHKSKTNIIYVCVHECTYVCKYRISAHLAACGYKRGLSENCLSDSGNDTSMPV